MNIEKTNGIQTVMKTWKISEPRGIILLCVWFQKTNVPICLNIYSTNCRISIRWKWSMAIVFVEDAHPWDLTWQWTIPSVEESKIRWFSSDKSMYPLGAYLHPEVFGYGLVPCRGFCDSTVFLKFTYLSSWFCHVRNAEKNRSWWNLILPGKLTQKRRFEWWFHDYYQGCKQFSPRFFDVQPRVHPILQVGNNHG